MTGPGGDADFLIFSNYRFTPLLPPGTFEHQAIMVIALVKLSVVVIYRPPGQMGIFVDELNNLFCFSVPEHDCPSLTLGHMYIHVDSNGSADFLSLILSFDSQSWQRT